MGCTLGVVVSLLAALELSSATLVWEYGVDVPGSIVVAKKNGSIKFWNKAIDVPIGVGPCMSLVYVHVKIEDLIDNPEVGFKDDTSTVLIKYGRTRYSRSWYEVLAKAIPTSCYSKENPAQYSYNPEDFI